MANLSRNHNLSFLLLMALCFCFGCEDEPTSCTCPVGEVGTIFVNPSPDHIRIYWELDGPGGSEFSGVGDDVLSNMLPGRYSISWRPYGDWIQPTNTTADLEANETIVFNGAYTEIGKIGILINPYPDHLDASWQITGPNGWSTNGSGDQFLSGLVPGQYTVTWQHEPYWAWQTPAAETLLIEENTTEVFSGIYTENIPSPFIPGNMLLSCGGSIQEYDRAGNLVQGFPVDHPSGSVGESRDIAIDYSGKLFVFNGTFHPYLSVFNPALNEWTHHQFNGWSTVANTTYGGIGAVGPYIFLTDMYTAQNGEQHGIIRFDSRDSSWVRFSSEDYIDLCIGGDGLLYALYPGGTPSGRDIDVFETTSLELVSTFGTPSNDTTRRIVVSQENGIYLSLWENAIQRISLQGELLETIDLSPTIQSTVYDLALDAAGSMAVFARDGLTGHQMAWYSSPFPSGGVVPLNPNQSESRGFMIWVPEYAQ